MAKSIPFEEMDSNGQFGNLMDDSAEKTQWNRKVAMELLEMATAHEDYAEKLRHTAATLILEAMDFANETATFLSMEFPMSSDDEEPGEEEANESV